MKTKLFAILTIVILLLGSLSFISAGASPQKQSGLIPVDMDPYFKSLTGEAAKAKIQADIESSAPELVEAAAAQAALDPVALGVGDVRVLYADGYREFTLKAIGGNAEVWVANDLSYCPGDPRPAHVVTQEQIDYLFNEFNNTIYPSNTTYFGFNNDRDGTGGLFSTLGYDWYETDNPQRMMILVYNIVDEGYCDPSYPFYVAGYFWPTMNDVYADRNIIHIDSYDWANRVGPDGSRPNLYEQVFTHEFEHAIHFDHDSDEPSWVDEGMADLAPFLAGYGHSRGHLEYYLTYHRTPLTIWGGGLEDYGESYLFQLYLLENFGGPAFIKALVNEQANGIAGIENQLTAFGYGTSFNNIYRDWTLANYLDDPSLTGNSGAKLGYDELDIPSIDTNGVSIQWSIKNVYDSDHTGNLPIPRYYGGYKSGTVEWPVGDLMPYTPMYMTYKGIQPELVSNFRGAASTGVSAHSGSYELWGGRGDLLFNTATTSAPVLLGTNASLNFWTFYEIEEAWDFGFVQISTDGGGTWTSLANADTSDVHDLDAHPDVIANLPGFTGHSGGWVEETFDLSAYAGESALFRFLYVTDWATVETGFYVDDVTIADDGGTLLADDLESGSGNWDLAGWEYTTGLALNDWELTFINPIYNFGKFSGFQIVDDNIYLDGIYQRDLTILNTQNLTSDAATIILSNHLPEDTSFPASYRILVAKGNAK
jgi:immune inhibitor A